jgi:hypothetical protein
MVTFSASPGRHRGCREAPRAEAGGERVDGRGEDRLGRVDGDAPRREIEAVEIVVGDARGAEHVGEVGRPRERSAIAVHAPEPERGLAHEVEGGDEDGRTAVEQREQEGVDQPHVVVERDPVDARIGRGHAEPVAHGADVVQHGFVREQDALGRAGGSRGVLHGGDAARAGVGCGNGRARRGDVLGAEQRRPGEQRGFVGEEGGDLGVAVEGRRARIGDDGADARGVDAPVGQAIDGGDQSGTPPTRIVPK